jgi:hypothetical protein
VRRPDARRAGKAEEFRFGPLSRFVDGVAGVIGPPTLVGRGAPLREGRLCPLCATVAEGAA